MKNIKSYLSKESSNILEANESKDKTFIELNVGDKIYYVMTLGEKYSKIYAGKVSWLDKLYKTSIYLDIEKSKDDDNLTLDHISVYIQNSSAPITNTSAMTSNLPVRCSSPRTNMNILIMKWRPHLSAQGTLHTRSA